MDLRRNPYVAFVVGLSMMSVSGTIYLFSVLSPELRRSFGLSTTQTALLGTSANIGVWAAIIPGIVFDKYGPLASALLAFVLLGGGFGGLAALLQWYSGREVSIVLLCILAFVYGQGSACNYASAVATTSKSFDPRDRGRIVGVLTCFFGLCAGIYALLWWAVGQQAPFFVLLLAILTSIISLTGGVVFQFRAESDRKPPRLITWKIRVIIGVSVFAALYVAASHGVLTYWGSSQSLALPRALGIGLCLILGVNTLTIWDWPSISLLSHSKLPTEDERESSASDPMYPPIESPVLQTIRTLDFWLLFTVFFFNVGTAIITVNHLADVVYSRLPNLAASSSASNTIALLVALFSSTNSLGRLGFGWLSDFLHERKIERAFGLVICAGVSTLVQLWMIFAPSSHFRFAVPFLGLVFGGTYCLLPQLCSLYFGAKNFGTNWGAFGVAPASGSVLMSTLLAGRLADHFASRQGEGRCFGLECYGYTYSICAVLGIISTVVAVILWRRRTNSVRNLSESFVPLSEEGLTEAKLENSDDDSLEVDLDADELK